MKKLLVLSFIGFIMLGCLSDDDNVQNATNCDFETILSAEEYANSPSHQLQINNLDIEDNCLTINFSSSGCSGDTWEVKLIDSEAVLESYPYQRNLRLSLNNEEECEAYITKEMSFDISNLQLQGNKIQLNITNSEESILYEY